METSYVNKITGFVIALVLGAIMVGGMLAPTIVAIQDGQTTTYTNNTTSNLTFKLDGSDDYVFESAPAYANYKVNGQPAGQSSALDTFIITDKCRCVDNGHYFQLFDESGTRISNLNVQNKNVVITYTASTKEFVYTVYTDLTNTTVDNSYTYTVENILYYIPGGDYGAIHTGGDPDITYYVNEVSQVIAGGAYTSGDLDTSYFAEGPTVYVGNSSYTGSSTTTTENVVKGVIKGSGYAITISDGENSETFTPYTVFVPLKVVGHTDNQIIYNTMFGVITLLAIVMLVVFAANAVRNKY